MFDLLVESRSPLVANTISSVFKGVSRERILTPDCNGNRNIKSFFSVKLSASDVIIIIILFISTNDGIPYTVYECDVLTAL